MVRTVRVNKALIGATDLIRIGFVVWWADAVCSVVPCFTDCIDSTVLIETRVLTISIDASFVICTF